MSQKNKKYKSLSIGEKILAIQAVEKGEKKKSEVAKQFGIPSSTLSTYLKNKDVLLESHNKLGDKRKRNRDPTYLEIDKAVVQPMDQGIIKNLKLYYRKKIITKILAEMNAKQEIKVDILIASRMLKSAWDEVKPETIRNCFKKAGFEIALTDEIEVELEVGEWTDISHGINFAEYVDVDDKVCVVGQKSDSDIIAAVVAENNLKKPRIELDESSDEDESPEIEVPKRSEILAMSEKMRTFFEMHENTEHMFTYFDKIESFTLSLQRDNFKQKRITSYFNDRN